MASTLTTANQVIQITLSATPLNVTEVFFAEGARSVELQFFNAAGDLSTTGFYSLIDTDAAALTTARSWRVLPGATRTIPLRNDKSEEAISKIYLASSVASGIVHVHSSEAD